MDCPTISPWNIQRAFVWSFLRGCHPNILFDADEVAYVIVVQSLDQVLPDELTVSKQTFDAFSPEKVDVVLQ